jgi:hypothetical protein
MDYVRGLVIAGLIAFAGAGGGVVALNLRTASPRLVAAGMLAAAVGIIGGGLALGRSLGQGPRDKA